MPGVILQTVGSPGLALSLWVLGALLAWAGLAIAIEYGAMLPRSGGIKVWLEYTYRRPRFLASTMVAVQAVVLGLTATNCIIFAKYTLFALGRAPTDFSTKLFAVGVMTGITLLHGVFYRAGILVQNVLGWLKLGLTAFMVLVGIATLFRKPEAVHVWENIWQDSNWEINTISTALFKVFYSFAGLENINNVTNELKNPISTIKTVGPTALLTACILYVLINIAYLSVVPLDQIKQSRELIAALFFERLGFGRAFLPLSIALSAAGNVMVVTFSLVRLSYWPDASTDRGPGAAESRGCSSGLPAFPTATCIECSLRLTPWWSPCPLYTDRAGDHPPTLTISL
jgi:amino acid transporter